MALLYRGLLRPLRWNVQWLFDEMRVSAADGLNA
jgi:hypothetical protein